MPRELGLDLIVTDHHLPAARPCPMPSPSLTPSGRMTKAPLRICAARVWPLSFVPRWEGCEPADLLEMYGELVALGTVADVMPLVGENRTLVREGLALCEDTMRPGLQALMENAGAAGKPVTADTVSWPGPAAERSGPHG